MNEMISSAISKIFVGGLILLFFWAFAKDANMDWQIRKELLLRLQRENKQAKEIK